MKIKIINIIMCALLCVIGVFAITKISVNAQSGSTFITTLGVTGPADPIAPSQPTNLTATTISTNQINLDWDDSTDNVGVDGYVVYRDSVAVATTTSTDYIDSSLSASTTYTYYIEAFDSALNYSTASQSVSATTFAIITPVISTENTSSGSKVSIEINALTVTPGITSAFISFVNTAPTLGKIYWGTTPDLEVGSISGIEYSESHTFKLDGLKSNTVYYFRIEVIDGIGRSTYMLSSFVTQSVPLEIEITNPQNFKANFIDEVVKLSWINPENFDSVVIVKSDKFFPTNIYEGKTIYEGDAESFSDTEIVKSKNYYYTIFAVDSSGKFSSGAIASVAIPSFAGQIVVTNPFDYLPPANSNDPKILSLKINDFDFYQDGIKLDVINGDVFIDGSKDITVSIDYQKLPEVLKTIALTVYDSKDSSLSFSFLLKINNDKTRYKAVISSLGKEGKFPVSTVIVDYKNRSLKKINGHFISSLLQNIEIKNPMVVWFWSLAISTGILIVLLWILVVVMKKIQK